MIKTIIIDDEPLATEIVLEYLSEFEQIQVLAVCHDGFAGLKAIKEYDPDLIFLDVQMPKITGFEMLELLENPPAVIFTTAYDEYAMKAFDTHAIDYLLKPFSKDRFEKAMEKYLKTGERVVGVGQDVSKLELKGPSERIVLKDRNDIKIIPYTEIIYLEANDDYVNIHTVDGKFLKNKTMKFFENDLDAKLFVRVHRSYIVKITEITKIESYEKDSYIVKLRSGESIPVSKSGYPKLKKVLGV
ncbi:LytTR family transcriptional regulator DNA-binding domain-containing protein [Belliella sp. R4-6]|uniref:LytTR family transcriptional regulator DNA-binding domain-containing protein n=1 Tax=Belliella alkalica TaxID=1730871 RepID=A0ABS9VB99_9BACT|nr:LytTR family transcriptional regulator DNA-binding domain-containing protein [Belliella alkalica]MCH7413704.1 LytTR family transcriptional regulator DNA-binding domain-containing protein [Belliella alkalica]